MAMERDRVCADLHNLKIQAAEFNFLETVSSCVATTAEVFAADNPLEGIALVLAEKIGLAQASEATQTAAFVLTKVAMLEAAQTIFQIGGGIMNLDLNSFTLARILETVKRIETKVDLILDAPLKVAIKHMKSAINTMESGNLEESLRYMDKVADQAMQGFEYAQKSTGIENFKNAVMAKKLLVFTKITKHSYNQDKKQVLPFYLLSKSKKELIAKELEADTIDILTLEKKFKSKSVTRFLPGNRKKEKGEIKDISDSLLKVTYPYVSEGKGWTSTWAPMKDEKTINWTVLPDLLPDGEEDCTTVYLGRTYTPGAARDASVLFKTRIWKKDSSVYIASHKSTAAYKFQSSSEEIVIPFDLTATTGKLVVSSTGPTCEYMGQCLGQYGLISDNTYKQENSRGGGDLFIYKAAETWFVSDTIGKYGGSLKNSTNSESVPVTGWQYADGTGTWPSDPDLTISAPALSPCSAITILATGAAARAQPGYLGVFSETQEWSAGRKVFLNTDTGKYLLTACGKTTWQVQATLDKDACGIQSASGTICPATARAGHSQRFKWNSWIYYDKEWKEGEIEVTCATHQ
jgi:hypothetical protein